MELWQINHVTAHRQKIIKIFNFSPRVYNILVERVSVLKDDPGNQVNPPTLTNAPVDSDRILDLLITQPNGYVALGEAAYQTGQEGTFRLLLGGLLVQLGHRSGLQCSAEDIDAALQEYENREKFYQFFLRYGDGSKQLLRNTVGAPWRGSHLYIPRSISNRVQLDKGVFREDCKDVFVFRGLSRSALSDVAGRNVTATSAQVRNSLKSRFILLIGDRIEDHWQKIVNISKSNPVHLIKYDEDSKHYILERSSGESNVISKFIEGKSKHKSLYDKEETFFENVDAPENEDGVCFCDSPGMGKTWILRHLAAKMQRKFPERIAAFISLPNLLSWGKVSPHEKCALDKVQALDLVLQFRSIPSDLVRALVTTLNTAKRLRFELFLDGFDEITSSRVQWTKDFLKILKGHESVRLFVASRPHMRGDLEETVGVRAYDLLPFSEDNQIEFLVRLWRFEDQTASEARLQDFGKACLKRLQKLLPVEEKKLFGIPLQCFLLGRVTQIEALDYAGTDITFEELDLPMLTSITEMYSKYINAGIELAWKFCVEATQKPSDPEEMAKLKTEKFAALKAFHVWKAVDLLCPEASDDLFNLIGLSSRDATPEHLACGLLYIDNHSNPEGEEDTAFFHRTVAEFLVAEYFAQVIRGSDPYDKDSTVLKKHHWALLKVLFSTQKHRTLNLRRRYLEGPDPDNPPFTVDSRFVILTFMFDTPTLTRLFSSCLRDTKLERLPEISQDNLKSLLAGDKASEVLYSSIVSGCGNIILFLKILFKLLWRSADVGAVRDSLTCKFKEVRGGDLPDEFYLSCCAYLGQAAKNLNRDAVTDLHDMFEACLGENLHQVCAAMPLLMKTPLHFAVERQDYNLVEYFSFPERVSLPSRKLLLHCVDYTVECPPENVENILSICELLLGRCESLIEEQCFTQYTHPEVIVLLAQNGAFLHFDPRGSERFFPKLDANTVRRLRETQGFVKVSDILFLDTVRHDGAVETVKEMVVRAADIHARSTKGEGALHLAATHGALEVARYLVSLKIPLEDRDKEERTPLLLAAPHLEMAKYLLSENADILAVDKDQRNIAHLAASYGNDPLLEYLLTLPEAAALFGRAAVLRETPLHTRLRSDVPGPSVETLKKILTLPLFNPHAVDSSGNNYFLAAINGGKSDLVLQTFKNLGVSPHVANKYRETALHLVAESGNLDAARYLLHLKLPLEIQDDEGNTPLLKTEDVEMMRLLVSAGANVLAVDEDDNNIAHKAYMTTSGSERNEILQYLLTLPQAPILFSGRNSDGRIPFQCVFLLNTLHHDCEMMKPVLDLCKNAPELEDETTRDKFCFSIATIVPTAVLRGLPSCVVRPTVENDEGQNALHLAARIEDVEKIEYLVSQGLSVQQRDKFGNTPLFYGRPDGKAARYFIERCGADIYAVNDQGDTFAHTVHWNANDIAAFLGGERKEEKIFTVKNGKGRTPLHEWLATSSVHLRPATVELILRVPGIDLNEVDVAGENAFYSAVTAGRSKQILQILHKFGGTPNSTNKKGENLIDSRTRYGYMNTVKYLESIGVVKGTCGG